MSCRNKCEDKTPLKMIDGFLVKNIIKSKLDLIIFY